MQYIKFPMYNLDKPHLGAMDYIRSTLKGSTKVYLFEGMHSELSWRSVMHLHDPNLVFIESNCTQTVIQYINDIPNIDSGCTAVLVFSNTDYMTEPQELKDFIVDLKVVVLVVDAL